MRHRISAGAIIQDQRGRLLLVRSRVQDRYDFWVCPGGGVKGNETLEEAAQREVKEETGLDVAIDRLLYIEEMVNPECRFVKFWFLGHPNGGCIDITHPEAVSEHIMEAAWLSLSELKGKQVFPSVILERLDFDFSQSGFAPVRIPLREMEFW